MQTRRRRPRSTGAGFVFSALNSGFDRLGPGGRWPGLLPQDMVACPSIRLLGKAALPPFPAQDAAVAAGHKGATGLLRLETVRQRPDGLSYWLSRSLSRGGVNDRIKSLLKKANRGLASKFASGRLSLQLRLLHCLTIGYNPIWRLMTTSKAPISSAWTEACFFNRPIEAGQQHTARPASIPGPMRQMDDRNGRGTTISISIMELLGSSLGFEGEAGPGPAASRPRMDSGRRAGASAWTR